MKHTILRLFRRSPFKPLQEHMRISLECVRLLRPLFNMWISGNYEEVRKIGEKISEMEHEADKIKNGIRDHLPWKILMPVDRHDFLLYLSEQDALPDKAEDIAVLLTLKNIKVPSSIVEHLLQYLDRVLHCAELAGELTSNFGDLIESSFGEKEKMKVLELADRLDNCEEETDKLAHSVAKKLFEVEDELSAVECFLMFQIFRELGSLADHSQHLAKRIRLMLHRA